MFLRIDKLQIELPRPAQADPESAGIVQELMGGKFGEMSTLVYIPEHKNARTEILRPADRRRRRATGSGENVDHPEGPIFEMIRTCSHRCAPANFRRSMCSAPSYLRPVPNDLTGRRRRLGVATLSLAL